jgi:CHASE2 domain-containing sensor protein
MVSPDVISARRKHIVQHTVFGLVLIIVVLLVVLAAEKMVPQVRAAIDYSYDWLQARLAPVDAAKREITVVDISNLQPRRDPSKLDDEPYTSRKELLPIIETIVRHRPLAIGIDIDFSPRGDGHFFTTEDRPFLEALLRAKEQHGQARFFVGVASGIEKGPSKWLGHEKYRDLAAHILRPKAEEFGPNPRMDVAIDIPYISDDGRELTATLPALAYAIAGPPPEPPKFLRWAVDRKPKPPTEGVQFRQFLVDFSPIDEFASDVIVASDAAGVRDASAFNGKIVIVGRGSRGLFPTTTNDTFTAPGRRERAYAGMLLHACAAYTLRGATLWEFKKSTRLLLDVLFSAVVLLTVAAVALYYSSRVKEDVSLHRLSRWLTFVMVLVVLFLGPKVASWGRVMWPDYIVVAGGLLLHASLEQRDSPIRVTLQALRRGWRAIGFAPADKGHTE